MDQLPLAIKCPNCASAIREADYCKEIIRRGKHGPTITYEVWVALTDGAQTRLVGAGLEVEQALYIEQQIELLIELKDKPMSGEVRR